MAQGRTHYEVLGVARDCTADAIKAAYQQLLLITHPDKAGLQKQQEFHALQEAYQTLKDRSSRALYDHQLSQAELKATVVLHDEIDVDDMDMQEQQEPLQDREHLPSDRQHGEFSDPVTCMNGGACTQAVQHQQYIYSYPCRCGDQYVMQGSDLQLPPCEIIIPCRSCSNHILVRVPPTMPASYNSVGIRSTTG